MVFTFRNCTLISLLTVFLFLGACSSAPKKEASQVDIYSALTDDNVQYRGAAEKPSSDIDPQVIQEHITNIRNLYFRKHLGEAQVIAERLLRLDSNLPEAYYWLARIQLEQGDFQQSYNLASKGITVASDNNLKRELERIQRQAQMGNY